MARKTFEQRVRDFHARCGPDACWVWERSKNAAGYGKAWFRGRVTYAHRSAYELLRGPIPDGLTIDHLCRNRACLNPSHLEAVPLRENLLRGNTLAARNAAKTHCPNGHELSGANLVKGAKGRTCRVCTSAYHLGWVHRNAERNRAYQRAWYSKTKSR